MHTSTSSTKWMWQLKHVNYFFIYYGYLTDLNLNIISIPPEFFFLNRINLPLKVWRTCIAFFFYFDQNLHSIHISCRLYIQIILDGLDFLFF